MYLLLTLLLLGSVHSYADIEEEEKALAEAAAAVSKENAAVAETAMDDETTEPSESLTKENNKVEVAPTIEKKSLPNPKDLIPSKEYSASIVNLRTAWYVKEHRERIVIDLNSSKEPAFYKKRSGNTISINLEASIEKDKNIRLAKILQKTHYINSGQIMSFDDEKEVTIQILVKKGVKEKFFTLANPSRLVIDLSYKKE